MLGTETDHMTPGHRIDSDAFCPPRAAVLALALFAASGCSTGKTAWPDAARPSPNSAVTFSGDTATVSLTPVTSRLRKARGIGSFSRNVGCWVHVRPLTDADFPGSGKLTAATTQAFTNSHIRVEPDQGADYRVRATIQSARVDSCNNSFFNAGPFETDAQIDVGWRVDDRSGVPVYEGSTSGYGRAVANSFDIAPAVDAAIADAASRLFQTAAIERVLNRSAKVADPVRPPSADTGPSTPVRTRASEFSPILIAALPPGMTGTRIPAVTAVETVTTAGRSGAGFYISTDGYFLTASAIIGDSASAQIAPRTAAHVVRQDSVLGLSLLKSGETQSLVRPLRQRPLITDESLTLPDGGKFQIASVADSLGRFLITSPVPAGSPVLDGQGNIAGIVLQGSKGPLLVPIGQAFRSLGLGLALPN